MKLDINQLSCYKKITITYFEDLYCTNGTQLAREPTKIWMDENVNGMYPIFIPPMRLSA